MKRQDKTTKEILEDMHELIKEQLDSKNEEGKLIHECIKAIDFKSQFGFTYISTIPTNFNSCKEIREATMHYCCLPYERMFTEMERTTIL